MSDKHLREKAVKSDRKMRSTPIAGMCFQFYYISASKKKEANHAKRICIKHGRKFGQIHAQR
jgi:hypothetical protein